MPSNNRLTPFRRDILLGLLALALVASPAGVLATNVAETTHTYERAEVVVDDEDGITYANGSNPQLYDALLSEDIGCSVAADVRVCAFEHLLTANATVPTDVYTNNPTRGTLPFEAGVERYEYVQINGSVYTTTHVPNRSVQNEGGLYRIDLALDAASAADALRDVSIDPTHADADTPGVVLDAARSGSAVADREVDVPRTPIRVGDDYYRVYAAGENPPSPMGPVWGAALAFAGPAAGLFVLYRIAGRIDVTYVGKRG